MSRIRAPMAILAGGLGTRLGQRTERIPKSLVEVHGRPFLERQLSLLRSHGFGEVILLVGHLGEQVKAFAGDGSRFGLRLRYSHDGDQLLGTAGAVKKAQALLGDPFFLTYGDSYLLLDYRAVLEHFQTRSELGLMVVYRNQNRLEQSNVVLDGDHVASYDKQRPAPGSDYVNFGVSLLRKAALALVPSGVPYSQEEWYQALIGQRQLLALETKQRFYEIGSPHGLSEFERMLSQSSSASEKRSA